MGRMMKDFYDKHIVENLEVSESPDDKEKKKGFVVWKLRSILLAFFIVWVLSALVIYPFFGDWEDSGPFGDTFGAINALFSAFAFGGLVYTLFIQRYELSLQRKELEMQRKEVARNGDQLEEQKNIMVEQSFESTFFKLIELHYTIIQTLTSNFGAGRAAVHVKYIELMTPIFDKARINTKEELIAAVNKVVGDPKFSIAHYLNNIVCMLNLIKKYTQTQNHDISDSDYVLILFSQFSKEEQYLLFYFFGCSDDEQIRNLLPQFINVKELYHESPLHYEWLYGSERDS
ncbi:hypothetical protein N6H13_25935 [Paenibacillus sp. CC-CFT742]|nr:putative phage abortive infection protein [Paenibacillus sp. CC-CFT742]WJH28436.1 hypothetical protein N6H13_25935 [Paenibacillus sp. CC-CFT742]